MRIRHRAVGLGICGCPLLCTAGARRQLPVVLEQVLEESVVPLHGVAGPDALEAASDRIAALAAAEAILPSEALLLQRGTFWFRTDVPGRRGSPMRFAERVSANNECS